MIERIPSVLVLGAMLPQAQTNSTPLNAGDTIPNVTLRMEDDKELNTVEPMTMNDNLKRLAKPVRAKETRITTGPVATAVEQSTGCAWGDYNNDGFLDLFVANFGNSGINTLYRNNGNGTFSRFTAGAPGNKLPAFSGGGVWEDYDNDGYLDFSEANGVDTALVTT